MQSSTLVQLLTKYDKERGLLRRLFIRENLPVQTIKLFSKNLGKSDRTLTEDELFKLATILVHSHNYHLRKRGNLKSENLRKQLIVNIEKAIQPDIWATLSFLSPLKLLNKKNFLAIYYHPQYQKQLNKVFSFIDKKSRDARKAIQIIIDQLKRWDVFYGVISMFETHFYDNTRTKKQYRNFYELQDLSQVADLNHFHNTLKKHLHEPLLSVAQGSNLLFETLLDFNEFAGDILKLLLVIVKQEEKLSTAISNIDKKLDKLLHSHQEISFLKLKTSNLDEVKEFVLQTLHHNPHQLRLQTNDKHVPFQAKNNNLLDFFPKVEKNQTENSETANNQLDFSENLRM